MSLQRKDLEEMGISSENIEKIIAGHIETVNSLKSELATTKEAVVGKTDSIKAEYDNKLNDLNSRYSATEQELKDLKAELESKKLEEIKTKAIKQSLKELNIEDKWFSKIAKTTDIPTNESNEIDIEALTATIKTNWGDVIPTTSTQGKSTATPKSTDGGLTREEIMNIKDTSERQKLIAENHLLFGF